MKKTRVIEQEIIEPDLVCKECNEQVFQCDNPLCENTFDDEGYIIYCAKRARKHYCSKCGKRRMK
jgi:hypothetical protein